MCTPSTSTIPFPVPSVFRRGTRPVHRGCFVWTPTPPLSGRRTPTPCPVRVCVCVFLLTGSGGPASPARFSAPDLSLGRNVRMLCSAPSRLVLPRCCHFVFVLSFRCGVFFPLFLSHCAPIVPRFSQSPASGALGLGAVRFPCRPPPFLCVPPRSGSLFVAPRPLFLFSSFLVFFSSGLLVSPPPPALAFFFWVSRCSALCVRALLLCFLSFLWLLPCSCCPPPPPPWFVFRRCRCISARCPVVFLCCFPPACLLAVLAACPPGVRVVPCAAWCRRAVLFFRLVFFAVRCCRIMGCVLLCGVPPCFVVGCSALCVAL